MQLSWTPTGKDAYDSHNQCCRNFFIQDIEVDFFICRLCWFQYGVWAIQLLVGYWNGVEHHLLWKTFQDVFIKVVSLLSCNSLCLPFRHMTLSTLQLLLCSVLSTTRSLNFCVFSTKLTISGIEYREGEGEGGTRWESSADVCTLHE